jgi:hypothetical protein
MIQALQNLSYAERLAFARTIREYYLRDKQDFQAYNATRFVAQWEIYWQAAIVAAETYITDGDIIDQSTSMAQQVETLLADSRKLYQRFIKPFIEDAFPNNKGMQYQFGLNVYTEYARTGAKMMLFLQRLYQQCTTHQATLVAVGINPAKIAEIDSLYYALHAAILAQGNFKGIRMSNAQTRQTLFAQLDNYTLQTCRTGKKLYLKQDIAKYRCYLLPHRPDTNGTKHKS